MSEFTRMLGANLRRARGRLNITQAQVAETLNVPAEVYGRMERGGLLPSLDTFLAMCRVLGDTSERLLTPPRTRR